MDKYKINIHWSKEDERYIAEVPELAGCMADGGTMQESLENAHTVIGEWIKTAKLTGRDIPAAKGKLSFA